MQAAVERHDLDFDLFALVGIVFRDIGGDVEHRVHLVAVIVADLQREPVRPLGNGRQREEKREQRDEAKDAHRGSPNCAHSRPNGAKRKRRPSRTPSPKPAMSRYLIFASRNSTCFLATGSYFFITSLSVMVREFLRVT